MRKVQPSGPLDAEILIVGEAPGAEEDRVGQPFMGASGQELTRMLAEAGIARGRCRITNVINVQPPGNEVSAFFYKVGAAREAEARGETVHTIINKRCNSIVAEGIAELHDEIRRLRPKMIIAVGSTALWALTGEGGDGASPTGITNWRGSMMHATMVDGCSDIRVMPTFHPAAVLRQWAWRSISVHDIRKASKWVSQPEWPGRNQEFITNPTLEQALAFIAEVRAAKRPFACDIETTARNISLISIANSPDRALCIPLMTRDTPDNCYWSEADEHQIVEALRDLFETPECGCIFQNGHYDTQFFLRHLGIYCHVSDDTSWMQHVLFPGTPKDLAYLASMYCEPYAYWKDELKDYRNLPTDEQKFRNYNCRDSCYTWEIWSKLGPVLKKSGLFEQYRFQMSLFDPILDMMVRGIRVDLEKRKELAKQVKDRLKELEEFLEALVGTHVGSDPRKTSKWYRSPTQMMRLFYEEMGFKPALNRKTQKPTIDDEALDKISQQNSLLLPLCAALKEYSSLDTFNATFLEARVDPDGRMRCSYNVAGTETYRFSSSQNVFGSGLNLQNIPRDIAINIRAMFVPDDGYVLLDFDLSSADLRVVTWDADEPELKQLLASGKDPYTEMAKVSFNDQTITKKHPIRQKFKNVCHGTNYVAGPNTISTTYGIPKPDVERTQRWWFSRFPRIKQWHTRIDRDVRTTRTVRNRFGYRRTYFDRLDMLLSQAVAWIGQSTVAVTINKALKQLQAAHPEVIVLMQVHDSLVIQIPKALFTPDYVRSLYRAMLVTIPYADPLVIPMGCKYSDKSWGECVDIGEAWEGFKLEA